jgi:hypothetical protein
LTAYVPLSPGAGAGGLSQKTTGAERLEQRVRMIDESIGLSAERTASLVQRPVCRGCSERARAPVRRTEEAPQMSRGRIDELHGHVAQGYGALAHEARGVIATGGLQSDAGCFQAVVALAMKVAGITLEKVVEDLAAADPAGRHRGKHAATVRPWRLSGKASGPSSGPGRRRRHALLRPGRTRSRRLTSVGRSARARSPVRRFSHSYACCGSSRIRRLS